MFGVWESRNGDILERYQGSVIYDTGEERYCLILNNRKVGFEKLPELMRLHAGWGIEINFSSKV